MAPTLITHGAQVSPDVVIAEDIVAPGVNDDSSSGFILGAMWVDTAANKSYVVVDISVGAAVWVETTAGAGGGESNTASSAGVGTSLFFQKSGVDLEFNAIKSENTLLTVALDGVSHDVELTLNEVLISHDVLADFISGEHFLQSAITEVGTIATGVWEGTAVGIGFGGTGQTAKTAAFDALAPGTTKGDVIVHNGTDNIRLAVGTNTHVLTADSGEVSGVKWAAGGGGGNFQSAMGFAGNTTPVTKGVTRYMAIGTGSVSIGVGAQEFSIPRTASLGRMYVNVTANSSDAGGNTITITKNGVATSVTVTYAAFETGIKSDLSNSFGTVDGDRIAFEIVNTASGGGTKNILIASISFELTVS